MCCCFYESTNMHLWLNRLIEKWEVLEGNQRVSKILCLLFLNEILRRLCRALPLGFQLANKEK